MPIAKKTNKLSTEEYMAGELSSEVKHELVDGHVYAMAGASANHERIAQNISREFGIHLKDSPCEPFGSDMKVRVRDNFYYPDVLIDCDFDESEPYYTKTPIIIVEVISKSTRKTDEQTKRIEYINIPTLQEYVIIEQDYVDVAVFRKTDSWQPTHYFLGDEVKFESIDLSLSVEEIYHRVQNEDMSQFIESRKAEG